MYKDNHNRPALSHRFGIGFMNPSSLVILVRCLLLGVCIYDVRSVHLYTPIYWVATSF